MPRMSQSEYESYLAKAILSKPDPQSAAPETSEAKLHRQIADECRRRGWLVFHGSMAHATFRTKGEPDFVIIADLGRTLLVECKSKTGKLSLEQAGVAAWAEKLGHKVHVVRSLAEFVVVASGEVVA